MCECMCVVVCVCVLACTPRPYLLWGLQQLGVRVMCECMCVLVCVSALQDPVCFGTCSS